MLTFRGLYVGPPRFLGRSRSMDNATGVAVLNEIMELFLREHESVPAFLREVLGKTNELISSDLGLIGIVEEMDGDRWVVVKDPARDVIGAESGEWRKYFGRARVGAEGLLPKERSFMGWVAHARRPRRCDDVRREEFYRSSNEEILSELAVPVLFQDEVLAVINLESKKLGHFTDEHQAVLELVAKLIALPLHSFMVRQGIRRPFADALEKIGRCLAAVGVGVPLKSGGILNDVASLVASAMNSEFCSVWLLEPGNRLALCGRHPNGGREIANGKSEREEALVREAIEQRCLRRFGLKYERDESGSSGESSSSNEQISNSPMMIAPMLLFGEAIGAVLVEGRCQRGKQNALPFFTGADEHLLNIIQGQLAASIQLKRREGIRLERLRQYSIQVSRVSKEFAELDMASVLEKAVLKVPELCKGRFCSVFLWDEARKQFVLAKSKGLSPELIGKAVYAPGEGLTGWVGLHATPLMLDIRATPYLQQIAPDLVWKAKYSETGLPEDRTMRPYAAVPIFRDGRTVGVLSVSDRADGPFTEADEMMMTLVAGKISTAMAYSERYEERLRLLHGLETVMACMHDLPKGKSDIDEVTTVTLHRISRTGRDIFGADIVTIYSMSEGALATPVVFEGDLRHREFMQSVLYPEDVPSILLVGQKSRFWADARGEHILVRRNLARDGKEGGPRFVEREGIESSAGVLLKMGERVVGMIFLNFRTPRAFDPQTRELIGVFATFVALILETLQLYEQIRDSASRQEARQLADQLHDIGNTLSLAVAWPAAVALKQLNSGDLEGAASTIQQLENYSVACHEELSIVTGQYNKETNNVEDLVRPHVEQAVAGKGIQVKFDFHETRRLSLRAERYLGLIAREAFHNALKHADPTQLSFLLEMSPGRVLLRIANDGRGFDPVAGLAKESCRGLKGIQRMVNELHGKLDIDSAPGGKGSVCSIDIPI